MYFNLWVVFLISGFWHGAAWNFIIWGGFHGLFLIADRIFLLRFYRAIGKFPSVLITFVITLVGWVLFRSENMVQVWDYTIGMFSFRSGNSLFVSREVWMTMVAAAVFGFLAYFPQVEKWQIKILAKEQRLKTMIWMTMAAIVFFVLSLGAITSSGFNPFIYFRF